MSYASRSRALFRFERHLTRASWVVAGLSVILLAARAFSPAAGTAALWLLLRSLRNGTRHLYDDAFDHASKSSTAHGISGQWDADRAAALRLRNERRHP